MADIIFKYELDESGTLPANKVIDEFHEIGATRGRIFVADYGPFFGTTVSMIDGVTGKPITSQQYKLVHPYVEAQQRTGKGVYAAVQITDPEVSTKILLTCQYVGGEFSYSHYALAEAVRALELDNRPIDFNDLLGLPSQWNPAPHTHNIYQTYAWEHLIWATNDVAEAIREGDTASRALLVSQIALKLGEFQDIIDNEIAELIRSMSPVLVTADINLEVGRRYIFMGNWLGTLPASGLVDGAMITMAKKVTASPGIKSLSHEIMTENGTDAREGVSFDVPREIRAIWIAASNRWELG